MGYLICGERGDVLVESSPPGILDAWIDFNQDGDWSDADEHVFDDPGIIAGANILTVERIRGGR